MNDVQREKIIDRRVQARLARDAAYRNAAGADEQAEREAEIESAVEAELDREEARIFNHDGRLEGAL